MQEQTSLFDVGGITKEAVQTSARVYGTELDDTDQIRLKGQVGDIYQALQVSPRLNIDLLTLPTADGHRRYIQNVTARISNLRELLKPHGQTVWAIKMAGGLWLYRLGPRKGDETLWDLGLDGEASCWSWKCPCCDKTQRNDSLKREEIQRMPLCNDCRLQLNV